MFPAPHPPIPVAVLTPAAAKLLDGIGTPDEEVVGAEDACVVGQV